jgi:hypothetical protein
MDAKGLLLAAKERRIITVVLESVIGIQIIDALNVHVIQHKRS